MTDNSESDEAAAELLKRAEEYAEEEGLEFDDVDFDDVEADSEHRFREWRGE